MSLKSRGRARHFANGFESKLPSMQPKQAKSMAESAFEELTNLISRGIDVVDEFTLGASRDRLAREPRPTPYWATKPWDLSAVTDGTTQPWTKISALLFDFPAVLP
jgi:hypothetical protein